MLFSKIPTLFFIIFLGILLHPQKKIYQLQDIQCLDE